MQTTTNKSPKLSNGEEIDFSLLSQPLAPMVMIHTPHISSERTISNSSFRKLGVTVFLFTSTGDTSIKMTFASLEDADLAADILTGFGVSANNEFNHHDSSLTGSRGEVFNTDGDSVVLGEYKNVVGVVRLPSFEVCFNMNTSGVSLDAPFPAQDSVNFQVRSSSEAGLHTYINFLGIKKSHFFDIEAFYMKLGYPMHRMNALSDAEIKQLITS